MFFAFSFVDSILFGPQLHASMVWHTVKQVEKLDNFDRWSQEIWILGTNQTVRRVLVSMIFFCYGSLNVTSSSLKKMYPPEPSWANMF